MRSLLQFDEEDKKIDREAEILNYCREESCVIMKSWAILLKHGYISENRAEIERQSFITKQTIISNGMNSLIARRKELNSQLNASL